MSLPRGRRGRAARQMNLPRYRKAETTICVDTRGLSERARLVNFVLRFGPHTTAIPGLWHLFPETAAREVGCSLDDFLAAFEELRARGLALADWSAAVVYMPRALEVDPPDNPNVIRGWRALWREIPECELKLNAQRRIREHCAARGRAFVDAFDDICGLEAGTIPQTVPGTVSLTVPGTVPPTVPGTVRQTRNRNRNRNSVTTTTTTPARSQGSRGRAQVVDSFQFLVFNAESEPATTGQPEDGERAETTKTQGEQPANSPTPEQVAAAFHECRPTAAPTVLDARLRKLIADARQAFPNLEDFRAFFRRAEASDLLGGRLPTGMFTRTGGAPLAWLLRNRERVQAGEFDPRGGDRPARTGGEVIEASRFEREPADTWQRIAERIEVKDHRERIRFSDYRIVRESDSELVIESRIYAHRLQTEYADRIAAAAEQVKPGLTVRVEAPPKADSVESEAQARIA